MRPHEYQKEKPSDVPPFQADLKFNSSDKREDVRSAYEVQILYHLQ